MEFGERLRSIIELRKQTMGEFAADAGIPYRTVQKYLLGSRRPGADHLIKLGAAGIDVTWLLTGFPGGAIGHYLEVDSSFEYEESTRGQSKNRPADQTPLVDAVLGDMRFAHEVIERAEVAVDGYHRRYHERTGELLQFDELKGALGAYVGECLDFARDLVAALSQPKIDRLSSALAKAEAEHLAAAALTPEAITHCLSRVHDDTICRVVEFIRWRRDQAATP